MLEHPSPVEKQTHPYSNTDLPKSRGVCCWSYIHLWRWCCVHHSPKWNLGPSWEPLLFPWGDAGVPSLSQVCSWLWERCSYSQDGMGELAGSWSFLGVAPILFLRHLTCTSLVVILGASALSSLFSLQLGFISSISLFEVQIRMIDYLRTTFDYFLAISEKDGSSYHF